MRTSDISELVQKINKRKYIVHVNDLQNNMVTKIQIHRNDLSKVFLDNPVES